MNLPILGNSYKWDDTIFVFSAAIFMSRFFVNKKTALISLAMWIKSGPSLDSPCLLKFLVVHKIAYRHLQYGLKKELCPNWIDLKTNKKILDF